MIEAIAARDHARDVEGNVESWNAAAEKIIRLDAGGSARESPPYNCRALQARTKVPTAGIEREIGFGVEAVRVAQGWEGDRRQRLRRAGVRPRQPATGYLTMMRYHEKAVQKQQNVIAQITMLLSEAQTVEDAIPQVLKPSATHSISSTAPDGCG